MLMQKAIFCGSGGESIASLREGSGSRRLTIGARESEWTLQRGELAVRENGLCICSLYSNFLSAKDRVAHAPSVTAPPRHLPLGWRRSVSKALCYKHNTHRFGCISGVGRQIASPTLSPNYRHKKAPSGRELSSG